jgi:hypothetical protein
VWRRLLSRYRPTPSARKTKGSLDGPCRSRCVWRRLLSRYRPPPSSQVCPEYRPSPPCHCEVCSKPQPHCKQLEPPIRTCPHICKPTPGHPKNWGQVCHKYCPEKKTQNKTKNKTNCPSPPLPPPQATVKGAQNHSLIESSSSRPFVHVHTSADHHPVSLRFERR